ncbi:MAG TPA: CpsD/CapB family tyrosine-protein kinase [Bacteroidota bacterium]|nr:CpsD/CapB family tyrosine-protein kinase [Bacteroidota bacterium]
MPPTAEPKNSKKEIYKVMKDDQKPPSDPAVECSELPAPIVEKPHSLFTQPKSIIVSPTPGTFIDPQTVAFHFYNAFNYSLLRPDGSDVRFAMGITSANPGEGKSLVASNLAVSLALGYKKRTVIVDANVHHPVLHDVFGTSPGPGLLEALTGNKVHLWQTQIESLHLLSIGRNVSGGAAGMRTGILKTAEKPPHLSLDQMTEFGEMIASLQMEYDFIIVDMPAINAQDFPILFANRLDGLLMVVDSSTTKRRHVDKVFRRLNENQVKGFVLNRVNDEND